MRKISILSFFLSILLLLFIVVFSCVSAATAPTITVSDASGKAGDAVTVEIQLSGNPGICTMRLYLHYAEELTLTGVEDTDLLHDSVFGRDYSQNPFILSWDDSLAATDNTENGVIARLSFKIKETAAAGKYRVRVSYDNGDIYNLELTDRSFQTVEGTVNVTVTPPTTESPLPTVSPAESETSDVTVPATSDVVVIPQPQDPNSPYTGSPVSPTAENPIIPQAGSENPPRNNTLPIVLSAILLVALLSAMIVLLILRRKRNK